jgi:hypothetical protein
MQSDSVWKMLGEAIQQVNEVEKASQDELLKIPQHRFRSAFR